MAYVRVRDVAVRAVAVRAMAMRAVALELLFQHRFLCKMQWDGGRNHNDAYITHDFLWAI